MKLFKYIYWLIFRKKVVKGGLVMPTNEERNQVLEDFSNSIMITNGVAKDCGLTTEELTEALKVFSQLSKEKIHEVDFEIDEPVMKRPNTTQRL